MLCGILATGCSPNLDIDCPSACSTPLQICTLNDQDYSGFIDAFKEYYSGGFILKQRTESFSFGINYSKERETCDTLLSDEVVKSISEHLRREWMWCPESYEESKIVVGGEIDCYRINGCLDELLESKESEFYLSIAKPIVNNDRAIVYFFHSDCFSALAYMRMQNAHWKIECVTILDTC